MKKIVLLCLLFPFVLNCQSINKLNENNGYKHYLFGTPVSNYKDLTLEIEEGSTSLYSYSNVPVQLDGAEFAYVRVTFLKNKLSAISLQTKNSTGKKFLKVLKENYGEPLKKNKAKENYEWQSEKVHLMYEKNMSEDDATISFYSNEMYKSAK